MNGIWPELGIRPADILLPADCDMNRWSVVACDQYTSQPEYWERVREYVGSAPSTLNLTFPEVWIDSPDAAERIADIHRNMHRYQDEGIFRRIEDALIYVERQLSDGLVRRGLLGAVDLEQYDYSSDWKGLIRATEGVVPKRLPPRVAVRQGADLELPHVLMLIDDPLKTVIEPLADEKDQMKKLYDFDLMEHGGHIRGFLLTDAQKDRLSSALAALADPSAFNFRWGTEGEPPMLFAVGDGNHSLASAKQVYEASKGGPDEAFARFSLVEVGNVYDDSLIFESINRVVFGTDPQRLLKELLEYYPGAYYGVGEGHCFTYCCGREEGHITIPEPRAALPIGSLQIFLEDYLSEHAGQIDYIHGSNVVRSLGSRPGNIGFIVDPIDKESLFETVIFEGRLPRKTFSMGQANDKRYYLEARRIRG